MGPDTDQQPGLELRDYVRVVRKSWALIVAGAVLGAAGAGALSWGTTPLYQAETSLYVAVRSANDTGVSELTQGGSYARQAVLSYVDVVTSGIVLEPVIEDLDLGLTTRELADMVTATSPRDTVLIDITVTDEDPQRAAEIANAVGASFTEAVVTVLEKPDDGVASPVQISTTQVAEVPEDPVSPRTTRNVALGLILGLTAGLGLAMIRYATDTHIRSQQDVERVTDVPILAGITDDHRAEAQRLTVHENPRSVRAEAFRSLRTNLQFVNVGEAPRSFVVTSAAPGEGKTTVAANLALSLAQTGASVVLVDADLRKPTLAKVMGVDGSVGLSNLLVGLVELDDVLHRWGDHDLFVLPAGRIPPNPSELLGAAEMKSLVEELSTRHDYVIIDSPPVLAVTDAALMSRTVGGTIVVFGVGVARRNDVVATLDALGGIANRIVGIVLTRVPSKGPDSYYHYGRYEYAAQDKRLERAAKAPATHPLAWLDDAEPSRLPRRNTT